MVEQNFLARIVGLMDILMVELGVGGRESRLMVDGECWMVDWKNGRVERWKIGRLVIGRMENWMDGRMGNKLPLDFDNVIQICIFKLKFALANFLKG